MNISVINWFPDIKPRIRANGVQLGKGIKIRQEVKFVLIAVLFCFVPEFQKLAIPTVFFHINPYARETTILVMAATEKIVDHCA